MIQFASTNAQPTHSKQTAVGGESAFVCTTVSVGCKMCVLVSLGNVIRAVLNVSPLVCSSDAHRPREVTSHSLPPPYPPPSTHEVSVDEYFMSVHHTSPSKTKKSAREIDVKCNGFTITHTHTHTHTHSSRTELLEHSFTFGRVTWAKSSGGEQGCKQHGNNLSINWLYNSRGATTAQSV
jgi:hypothetical protein